MTVKGKSKACALTGGEGAPVAVEDLVDAVQEPGQELGRVLLGLGLAQGGHRAAPQC